MALIVSNISGSQGEGFLTGSAGIALIAVTGAMAISANPELDYSEFAAAETNFYVSGSADAKAAVFVGDVEVDGGLTLIGEGSDLEIEGDVLIEGSLTVQEQSEFQNSLYVTGGLYLDPADSISNDNQAVPKSYVDGAITNASSTFTISGSDDGTTTGNEFDIDGGDTLTLIGKEDQILINLSVDSIQIELTENVVIAGELTATTGSFIEDVNVGRDLTVLGNSVFEGSVNMENGLVVTGTLIISDDEDTGGLIVEGDVLFEGPVTMEEGLVVSGGLYIDADTDFNEEGDWHVATIGYVNGAITNASSTFTILGDDNTTTGNGFDISGGDTLGITGSLNQIEIEISGGGLTFALADELNLVSGSFSGDVTIEGDLTVNGITTTINTENLLVEDPFILLASNANSPDTDGGIIILSGANDGSDLAIGRVDDDTWGVVKLDSASGEILNLDSGILVNFRVAELQISGTDDYIALSGSNDDLHVHAANDLLLCAGIDKSLIVMEDGVEWLRLDLSTNAILPASNDTLDLGSDQKRFKNVYTGDLHLQNDRGSWTLIEENNFITFRNNNTGRRFKMLMEDITDSGTYGPGNDGKM
jgi:cytoskeletal protein CcmA (bactofilin family)